MARQPARSRKSTRSSQSAASNRAKVATRAKSKAAAPVARTRVAKAAAPEPSFDLACQWWPDLTQHYTGLGWKDHLFRFNVFFSGAILAKPDMNRRTEAWKDEGMFVRLTPPGMARGLYPHFDDRLVTQHWLDCPAPVLSSRVAYYGVEFEQTVFAHIPGGEAIATGVEPLFAWLRIRIIDRLPALKAELPPHDRQGMSLTVNNAGHVWTTMVRGHQLMYDHHISKYPRDLTPEPAAGYDRRQGWRLLEPDGRVRLGVCPGQDVLIDVLPGKPIAEDYQFHLWIPPQVGAQVDVLLPMTPMDRATFDTEMALGYDAALEQSNRFWSRKPAAAATFRVPEKTLAESVAHCVRNAEICAERNPADGCYTTVTSAWAYSNLWPTPNSMTLTCFLDLLGYHDLVDKYLAIFKTYQGTIKPPGDSYTPHPGYFASPKTLTSIDWLSDHGAILYAAAHHALLSNDRGFVDAWLEAILKACDFIRESRARTGHGGVEGILPPAVATDRMTQIQGIWNDGWCHKGYATAVRLLRRIGHPRAEEFAADAREYRAAFQKAFRDYARKMPTWKDARGRTHPFLPTAFTGDVADENRHAFYLDTGPLFLVYAGLMDAADPLMASTRLWFREGPQHRHFRREAGCWQVPVLVHEMSSCEPCYSWVGFHSWQLGDRHRFLEAMYSLFAGAMSRQTFSYCETRGGIMAVTSALPHFQLARLAVIDDQIEPGCLHLLRLMPLAWLNPRQPAEFLGMPTEFGPVDLAARLSRDGRKLDVTFQGDFHTAPEKVLLHAPPLPGLTDLRVNGKRVSPGRRPVRVDAE